MIMSFFQSVISVIATDWHKMGIAFLVIKELKKTFAAIGTIKDVKSFVKNLFTKTGRALVWAQVKNFFAELF